jgi:hypothetical protein
MMDKITPYRGPQQPSPETEPAPFAPGDVAPERPPRENYIEAAAQLQRDLDRDAVVAANRSSDDPYLALPAGVRANYSRAEYMWLSDAEKSTLVQRECEPDC